MISGIKYCLNYGIKSKIECAQTRKTSVQIGVHESNMFASFSSRLSKYSIRIRNYRARAELEHVRTFFRAELEPK